MTSSNSDPPAGLDAIRLPPGKARKDPDEQSDTFLKDLDGAERIEEQRGRAELQNLHQNIELRRVYAGKLYWMVCIWLCFVALLLVVEGISYLRFDLPTPVLLATIGSTTVSVIGLFIYVTKYLFAVKGE